MNITDLYIQRALEANPLREPILRDIIQSLQLPSGSRGLDAGCGIGLQALLLAEAVGPTGQVVGMDLLLELLAYGKEHTYSAGYQDRVAFCAGDISRLPFEDQTFDWVWSADCIGYPAGNLAPVLAQLIRVVRPGGRVIVSGWSSQQLLPGYPLLEARLNATCSSYLPFWKGKSPEQHFLRAIRSFNEAGFEEVRARTFVGNVQAPLSSGERTALAALFEMLWVQPPPGAEQEDWQEYQRLCKPESTDFILNSDDYYAFFTYSMFRGRVPGH
jgi:SAM-dependent methyltransferase